MTLDPKDTESRLRSAVEQLARPGVEALESRRRPDDLAIEFDEAYTCYVAGLDRLPSDRQLQSLQTLDDQLQAMSDPEDRALWTPEAMKHHPEWGSVRTLAWRILVDFEWAE